MDIQQLLRQIFGGMQPSPNLLVNPGETQARVPNLLAQPAPQALPQDQFGSRFAGAQPTQQAAPALPAPISVNDHPIAQAQPVDPWAGMREVTNPGVDPMVTGSNPNHINTSMAPGTQGQIKRGPDGKSYQYVETSGMAGDQGGQGWIPVNQNAGGGVFGGLKNPFTDSGFKERLGDMMLGWGMGSTPQESLAMGNRAIMAGNLTRKEKDEQNQTVDWLKSKGLDDVTARAMASNKTALAEYLQQNMAQKKPIEVNGQLVDPTTFQVIGDFRTPNASETKPMEVSKGASIYDPVSKSWIQPPQGAQTSSVDFGDIAGVRKEVQGLPSYKNLAQAAPIWESMVNTSKNDSKASDLNLVYGLGKIFDPNSVVREGEMVMVKDSAGLSDQVLGWINAVNGGARLTPDVRKAIMQEAQNRVNAYSTMYKGDLQQYQHIADSYKIDPQDILPPMPKIQDLPDLAASQGAATVQEGVTATNPQTGQKIIFRNGNWVAQ